MFAGVGHVCVVTIVLGVQEFPAHVFHQNEDYQGKGDNESDFHGSLAIGPGRWKFKRGAASR